MSLISIEFVKTYFPLWDKFFLDSDGAPSETVLNNIIILAESKFAEYVSVTADTISAPLRLHLLNIVCAYGFNLQLGDREFESRPAILRNYDSTIEQLQKYKDGSEIPLASDNSTVPSVIITSKSRRFTAWFNPDLSDVSNPY